MTSNENKVSIKKLIGTGYENGWFSNCNARYRVFAGARNTKKSYTLLGYEIIIKLFSSPYRNICVIRNTLASHRDSTFATILRLLNELHLLKYCKINKTNMIITRKATGQIIGFKGMDEPYKITSIRAEHGIFSDVYVEEAFEVDDYDKWRIVDGSFRVSEYELDKYGLNIQITFVLNTWNKNHWIYTHFFKDRLEDNLEQLENNDYVEWYDPNLLIDYGKGLYLHKSTYKINEFRNKEVYDLAMNELKQRSIELYKIEALGMWGTPNGATYPELNQSILIDPTQLNNFKFIQFSFGIDTGLSNGEGSKLKTNRLRSATTLQFVGLCDDYATLVSIDEFFYSNESNINKKTEPELAKEMVETLIYWHDTKYKQLLSNKQLFIYVDNADIGFRHILDMEAKRHGAYYLSFIASTKMKIQTRVDFIRHLMAYKEFYITTNVKNLYREMQNSQKGHKGEARENFDDHAINANEYAWAPMAQKIRRFADIKQVK